jgi:hypothetical protein
MKKKDITKEELIKLGFEEVGEWLIYLDGNNSITVYPNGYCSIKCELKQLPKDINDIKTLIKILRASGDQN